MELKNPSLPSLGKVYPLEEISVRTLKGKDEKILAEINLENLEEKYTALLRNVVSGIDVTNLTLGDRNWLLLWQRINSYSPIIQINFTCENCFQSIFLDYDISQIEVENLSEEFVEPYSIILNTNEKIALRLFRIKDELNMLKWQKKHGLENAYLYYWASTIVSESLDIFEKIKLLEEMDAIDLLKIKKFHTDFSHGPKMNSCAYVCPKCGGEGRMTLPFRPDFLIPSSKEFK